MCNPHLDPASEALAQRLEADPLYRVLRAVPPPTSFMPECGAPPDGRCVAILDTETTGLDPNICSIIELAVKLVFVDDAGRVLAHFPVFDWCEDPCHPLTAEIARLTGLTDEHLAGKRIDDEAVEGLLDRADVIVAHNAAFDAAFIEKRWPQLAGKAWACSSREIDWAALRFEGRAQQHLLMQIGWFATAHRAAADVWSLFWLLSQERTHDEGERASEEGCGKPRTHLARLLEASSRATVRVEAIGAPYKSRHELKDRGYAWDAHPLRKVWWRELAPEEVEAEQLWFNRTGLPAPRLVTVTAFERHR